MSRGYDLELFAGAAEYYAKYRPRYPRALFDFLIARFRLDHTARVLDLGCGPGNASFSLAGSVGEIVAMDPDPGMVAVARRLADEQHLRNTTVLQQGSEDITPVLGRFRLVVMGASFHWMDREQVLRDLHPLIDEGGGIALAGVAHGFVLEGDGPPLPKPEWLSAVEAVEQRYVGARTRHPRSNPGEPRHERVLMRSQFRIAEYHEFENERRLTIDAIIGERYSMSGNLRGQLGDRLEAFERDVRNALLALVASGEFIDWSRAAVLVALK